MSSACQDEGPQYLANLPSLDLPLPSGEVIQVFLAKNIETQTQGLSGTRSEDFGPRQGMLFIYDSEALRQFWMPDTYFNLDIFFLNKEFMITHIERNIAHHQGRDQSSEIPRTPRLKCQYVLEMRADSVLSQTLKTGDQLNWLALVSQKKK